MFAFLKVCALEAGYSTPSWTCLSAPSGVIMGWGSGKGYQNNYSGGKGSSWQSDSGGDRGGPPAHQGGDSRSIYGLLYKEREKLAEVQQKLTDRENKEQRDKEMAALEEKLRASLKVSSGTMEDTIRSMGRSSGSDGPQLAGDRDDEPPTGMVKSIWQAMKKFTGRASSSVKSKHGKASKASKSSSSSSSSRTRKKQKNKKKQKRAQNKEKDKKSRRTSRNSKSPPKEIEESASEESSSIASLKLPTKKSNDKGPEAKKPKKAVSPSKKSAKQFDKNCLKLKQMCDDDEHVPVPKNMTEQERDRFAKAIAELSNISVLSSMIKENAIAGGGRSRETKVRAIMMHNVTTETEQDE